jgi:hypothetical protein
VPELEKRRRRLSSLRSGTTVGGGYHSTKAEAALSEACFSFSSGATVGGGLAETLAFDGGGAVFGWPRAWSCFGYCRVPKAPAQKTSGSLMGEVGDGENERSGGSSDTDASEAA